MTAPGGSTAPSRVAVLGVGNVLTGDDALGPTVARTLEARYELPPGVEVEDAGTPGMDLASLIGEADALIVVDTVMADGPPGTVHSYDRAALLDRPLAPRVNPHAPGLAETLLTMELAGGGPRDVLLVGVVPGATEVGVGMSAAVSAAIPEVIGVVVDALTGLGLAPTPRSRPREPDLWWEGASRGAFVRGSGRGRTDPGGV